MDQLIYKPSESSQWSWSNGMLGCLMLFHLTWTHYSFLNVFFCLLCIVSIAWTLSTPIFSLMVSNLLHSLPVYFSLQTYFLYPEVCFRYVLTSSISLCNMLNFLLPSGTYGIEWEELFQSHCLVILYHASESFLGLFYWLIFLIIMSCIVLLLCIW